MRHVSNILLALGLLLLALVAGMMADSALFEHRAARQMRQAGEQAARGAARPASMQEPGPGELIGWLQVRRLDVSAAIAQGTDRRTLRRSVGHIEGTAMPGDTTGNVGLAGHRDMHFRKLKDVAPGDTIQVRTLSGRFDYLVDSIRIVGPRDVEVLKPTRNPTLTLVTCYPFYYLGRAPRRFIVHASLRNESFDAQPPDSPTAVLGGGGKGRSGS